MKIQLPRGSYAGRSSNVNAQVVQNLYSELDQEGGKTVMQLYGTPGMVSRATLSADTVVRGLYPFGDTLYAVSGAKLYSVDTDWTVTELGDMDASTGPVYMDDDGTYIGIADRTSGYSFHTGTSTFAKITDGDYIGSNAMCFMDGYWITCYENQFQYSELLNPTSWVSTSVKNVRTKSDNIVTVVPYANFLWCLKDFSTELYYNTGEPFERYPGGFFERGIASAGGWCRSNDFLYWLTDDRELVQAGANLQLTKISTVQLDFQFKDMNTISDAVMYFYTEAGHSFIVLTFPTESKTFVYDESTGAFHTRTSYNSILGSDIRHFSNCYAFFNGYHVVGHYSNGKICTLDLNTYTDDSNRIRRIATFPTVYDPDSRKKLKINRFEVEFESGVGLTGGVQGEDPQAIFQVSKDGGHTWGNQRWASMGKIGEYKRRSVWRRCGTARDWIPRITITDPVKVVIVSAYADVEKL